MRTLTSSAVDELTCEELWYDTKIGQVMRNSSMDERTPLRHILGIASETYPSCPHLRLWLCIYDAVARTKSLWKLARGAAGSIAA